MKNTPTPRNRPRFRRWVVGSLLVLGLVVGGVAAWRWTSKTNEPEIRQAFRDRRFDDAEAAIEAWRKRAPRSPEPAYWKARLELARRHEPEFAAALKLAETQGLDRDRLDLLRALSTALGGRFAEVELKLRDAFNYRDRDDPDPLVLQALASGYVGTYDFPRANLVINRWISIAPKDPAPLLLRAEINARNGNRPGLIGDYRAALALDPKSAVALLGLANALLESHQVEEGAEVIARYLQGHPDDPAGQLCAAKIARERGRPEEAVDHFQRAIAIAPEDAVARKELGEVYLQQGDLDKALEQLDKAKAIDPFDLDVRHNRGIALVRLGNTVEAKQEQAVATRFRAELQTMLAAQSRLLEAPADLDARLQICKWMFEHGKADQGQRWAETILKDHPGQAETCKLLTDHFERAGQPGLANYYRLQAELASKAGKPKG